MTTTCIPASARARRQAGLTLVETLVALAIFALVIGGALSLFGGAASSQSIIQLTSDLTAVRASTKSLYYGQGTYGTGPITEVLINSKKIPSTLAITGTAPARVVNHPLNGQVTVEGQTSQFTVTTSNIPTDVCIGLAVMAGWDSVKIGAAAARTPPVSPATASTDCAAGGAQSIVFTGS